VNGYKRYFKRNRPKRIRFGRFALVVYFFQNGGGNGLTDGFFTRFGGGMATVVPEFGGIIRGMAYPDSGITKIHPGTSYETIRQILAGSGIAYARSLGGDNDRFLLPEDWYNLIPTAHHNNPQVLEFAEKFVAFDYEKLYSANRYPRLFYLWGHSYEFDNNDNWDRIEAILQILAGREDTWYPTNIQLRDYVAAYESLISSADNTKIYNPTLLELWFDVDGTLYNIKPGETLTLV
jgi:hypothetical protein